MVNSSVLRSLSIVFMMTFLTACAVANSNNGESALSPKGAILANSFFYQKSQFVENRVEKPLGEKLLNSSAGKSDPTVMSPASRGDS